MDTDPKLQALQASAWWSAWGGDGHMFPALPPERLERGRKEKGCPNGSQLEGRGALGHGQEGVRSWPWDTRLGKHPSPGKGMRGKGLCVLRLQTRTCWELREPPGQVGRAPGPLPTPSPHTSPSETETHRKGSAVRLGVLGPKLTGQGQWLHPPYSRSQ